jgi:cell division protein ZapA
MPEVEISIGGRIFEVACQQGEEHYLQAAAKLLDGEASHLTNQMGRLSEGRMLLMAGLMLADKTAGMDDQLRELEDKLRAQDQLITELRENSNVPSQPAGPSEELETLVTRTEELAGMFESAATG